MQFYPTEILLRATWPKDKKEELRRSSDRRSSGLHKRFSLELYHVLGLGAFGALDHLKLHFLVFGQGTEAFALYGAVMHEDIGAVIPRDEAIAFGIVKPFYSARFLHGATS
jgi:hypothetical protein